jgi:hypothetical protein
MIQFSGLVLATWVPPTLSPDLVVFETPNSAEQESTEWKEPGIISNLTKT